MDSRNRLLGLLQNVLGEFKSLRSDETLFFCPFCHHAKQKLAINVATGSWHCWVCPAAGRKVVSLFKKLQVSKSQIAELYDITKDEIRPSDFEAPEAILYLPQQYTPLWIPNKDPEYKQALAYLKRRNISAFDILRYRIGYCTDGPYSHRIIIPSYDGSGKLNYFVARAYYEGSMDYRNPTISKNIVGFESQINWKEDVILCEGVFDAMAIKRNAIPLLGKTISPALRKQIVLNNVRNIYLSLDKDALRESLKLSEQFMKDGRNVYLVDIQDKDPSKIGFKKMAELKKSATRMTFSDLIKLRLSLV